MTAFKFISSSLILTTFSFLSCSTSKTSISIQQPNQDTIYIASTDDFKSNKIPDSVFQMKMLKTLIIGGRDCDNGGVHNDNKPNDGIKCWAINEIPSSIGNLSNLDTLRLTLGAFKKFPDEISNLKKLRFLDLTITYISDINNLMTLQNLNQLLLFGCGLSKLPYNIGNLKNLKFIGLVRNNLDSIEINRIRKALPNCEVYFH